MLTPREIFTLPGKKFSPEKYRTHDAASSRTVSPTHCQGAIPAPERDDSGWTLRCQGQSIEQKKLIAGARLGENYYYLRQEVFAVAGENHSSLRSLLADCEKSGPVQ